MCDCRNSLMKDEDGAIVAFIAKKYKGATVQGVDFKDIAFPMSRDDNGAVKMRCVSTSNLTVEVVGRTRPVVVSVMHGFCPFCGAKYE